MIPHIKNNNRFCTLRTALAVFGLLCLSTSYAQLPDSIRTTKKITADTTVQQPIDTAKLLSAGPRLDTTSTAQSPKKRGFVKRFLRDDFPNPKKAALLSLIIPGGGQLYNRRYIKAPIVIGGIGFTTFLIFQNTSEFKKFRKAHLYRVDGDAETVDEFVTDEGVELLSASDLRQWRDIYQKNKELAYVATIAIFTLSAVEAFVDAHLRTFDVDENLGMRFKPKLEWQSPNGLSNMGLGLVFELGRRKQATPKVFYVPVEP